MNEWLYYFLQPPPPPNVYNVVESINLRDQLMMSAKRFSEDGAYKGNTTIGSATRQEAWKAGKAWVGPRWL